MDNWPPPALAPPEESYLASYLEALREGLNLDRAADERDGAKISGRGFQQWLHDRNDLSIPLTLPDGSVTPRLPQSDFWLLAGDRFLGQISVRHRLNETLLRFGGHIGYAVRVSERKKGYGSLMLRLVLPRARALGLDRVLLTCGDDNFASIKIIEACGGVLQDKVEFCGLRRRYWIAL